MMSDDRIYSDFISLYNLTEGGDLSSRKSQKIIGPQLHNLIDMKLGVEFK